MLEIHQQILLLLLQTELLVQIQYLALLLLPEAALEEEILPGPEETVEVEVVRFIVVM